MHSTKLYSSYSYCTVYLDNYINCLTIDPCIASYIASYAGINCETVDIIVKIVCLHKILVTATYITVYISILQHVCIIVCLDMLGYVQTVATGI